MIDHAILKPELDLEAVRKGCEIARKYETASVCVRPADLPVAAEILAGTTVKLCTVIGFPHGGQAASVKLAEARQALEDGAVEVDLVSNLSAVQSGLWALVAAEIRAAAKQVHAAGARIKVIFETCWLDEAQTIRLCEVCTDAGADWVKTSTGFGSEGATDAALRLMRRHCPARVQVKASGGIRTLARLLEVRALGASRAGTSATGAILEEARGALGLPPLRHR